MASLILNLNVSSPSALGLPLVLSHPTVANPGGVRSPTGLSCPLSNPPPQTTTSHKSLLSPQQSPSVQGRLGGGDILPAEEGATKEFVDKEPPAHPPSHASSLTIAALGAGGRSQPDRKLPAPDRVTCSHQGVSASGVALRRSAFSSTPRMRIGARLRHRAVPDARGLVADPRKHPCSRPSKPERE